MGLPAFPATPAAGRILLAVLTVLAWSLAARESQARNDPAAAGIALGALQAAILLGRAMGTSLPEDLRQTGALLLWALGCAAIAVAVASHSRTTADAGARTPRQQGLLPRSWGLSPRETEVARAVLRGEGRGRIAQQLGVSEETVKTYVRRLYAKAGVRSREELESAALDGQGDNPSDSRTPL